MPKPVRERTNSPQMDARRKRDLPMNPPSDREAIEPHCSGCHKGHAIRMRTSLLQARARQDRNRQHIGTNAAQGKVNRQNTRSLRWLCPACRSSAHRYSRGVGPVIWTGHLHPRCGDLETQEANIGGGDIARR